MIFFTENMTIAVVKLRLHQFAKENRLMRFLLRIFSKFVGFKGKGEICQQ